MSGSGGAGSGQRTHGPYHRIHTPSQTEQTARLQFASGQVWGREAKWSSLLSVKAYRGPLPPTDEGIEFYTDVQPSPGQHPSDVFWYAGTHGVTVAPIDGRDFAIITVRITTYRYL
jgi:hypothetical protein